MKVLGVVCKGAYPSSHVFRNWAIVSLLRATESPDSITYKHSRSAFSASLRVPLTVALIRLR